MNDGWYKSLEQPPLTPPDWIFGPVWTILYIMIALSILLYFYKTKSKYDWNVILLVSAHLISNIIWTPLFFWLQSPGMALLDIIFLDLTLILMIVIFWKSNKTASILLWPYLLWVSFASYLNVTFFLLN